MISLLELDRVTTELVKSAYSAIPMKDFEKSRLVVKSTPDGSVRNRSYDFYLTSGVVDQGTSPDRVADRLVDSLAHDHWLLTRKLGQPPWYKMIVTIERSGKYSIDFEYKDNYREGEILQRG